jgi:hypothetical protein
MRGGKQLVTTSKSVVSGEYSAANNAANIRSREGIAAANNQQKSDAVNKKIEASKNGAMKPGELMRAITNRANRLMISIDEAKKQYKDAGFNVDILN